MSDEPEDPDDLGIPPSFFPYEDGEESVSGFTGSTDPVKVEVEAVFATQNGEMKQFFVLLTDGHRKLPIVIGQFEAAAITFPLEGQQPDRPLTHDLLRSVIDRLDVKVTRVVIDDLWGSTYYAKIYMQQGNKEILIDSRPSDAIALAVRTDAPVYVADGILEQNGTS